MPLPDYLSIDLPKQVRRNVSCFRLQAHRLKVETARFVEDASNVCDKCDSGEIQDEKHVLFYCGCQQACDLRHKFSDLFERLRCLHGVVAVPRVPLNVDIDNRVVMDFLSQKSVRLFKCLSELLDVFAE